MNSLESTGQDLPPFAPGAAPSAKGTMQETVQTAREKLEAAGSVAREKIEAASSAAKEQFEAASSSALQWVRENPATALLTIFASGLAVGFALARGTRHEPTFRERFSEEPLDTIREAVFSALSPISARLQSTAQSARSAAGKAAGQVHDCAESTGAWWDKFRRNNL